MASAPPTYQRRRGGEESKLDGTLGVGVLDAPTVSQRALGEATVHGDVESLDDGAELGVFRRADEERHGPQHSPMTGEGLTDGREVELRELGEGEAGHSFVGEGARHLRRGVFTERAGEVDE